MKLSQTFLSFVLVSAATLALPGLGYGEFKVATIDMTRVLNDADAAKDKREEIDKLIATTNSKGEDKKKALIELQEKITESNNPKDVDKFDKDKKELDRFLQDSREEIGRKIQATSKTLSEKAISLIGAYAKAHSINIVIDKSKKFRGPVLFSEETDITDEIIKEMNE